MLCPFKKKVVISKQPVRDAYNVINHYNDVRIEEFMPCDGSQCVAFYDNTCVRVWKGVAGSEPIDLDEGSQDEEQPERRPEKRDNFGS